MKKVILMLVMLFTMSMYSFAEDANANEVNVIEQYDLKVNLRKLGLFLQLSSDQMDGMTTVETEFQNDLMFAAVECTKENRKAVTKNAINKHLQHVHYVLNKEQYHKYLMLLNATIRNRKIDIIE